jgi:simple sugar transport system ATP-binding protein
VPAKLQLHEITKRFPHVVANDRVSLDIDSGQIHALLGENGAGKTTLMELVYGLHQPDGGTIVVDGTPRTISSPKAAMELGIGMVHQHFTLVPTLTVAENIILGMLPSHAPLRLGPVARRIETMAADYQMDVDPKALVADLSTGQQQRVEILKALYRQAQILILDEPTALLGPLETEHLFRVMRGFASEGRSVIFITHKLREVREVANKITVLRRGRLQATLDVDDADEHRLTELMMGERGAVSAASATPSSPAPAAVRDGHGPPIRVEAVTVHDERGHVALQDLTFAVRPGEILGVAGVEGNGQRELAEALVGLRKVESGRICIAGEDINRLSHAEVVDLGVGFIPEDRRAAGLVMSFTIEENVILRRQRREGLIGGGFFKAKAVTAMTERLIKEYAIAAPSPKVAISTLSGGNQQKVVLARELHGSPRVLVVAQPTRGLDVSAARHVQGEIRRHRNKAAAVVLISSDLDEIQELSDRIAVLYEGRCMDILPAAEADRHRIGLLMAGHSASSDLKARNALA